MPNGSKISTHVAEVLRQFGGTHVIEDGWVGGDSWFGSVHSSVELRNRLGVHSTFIIKTRKGFFPIKVLHSMLIERHRNRPSGHWVKIETVIHDVKIIVMVCE